MPTFIKTGFWESAVKSYKGWLNLEDLISNSITSSDVTNALGYTPVPNTRTITINGTTQDLSANRTFTIAAGITGSGVANQLTYWNGTGSVTGSANLVWDNTNARLGIGIASPLSTLHVASSGFALRASLANGDGLFISNDSTTTYIQSFTSGFDVRNLNISAQEIIFRSGTVSYLEKMRLTSAGRLLLGTTTEGTFIFDAVGTARVSTSLEIIGTAGITFGGGVTALSYAAGSELRVGNAAWSSVHLYLNTVSKYSHTASLTTITNTTINLSTATVQLAGVNALTYSGTDIRIGSVAAGFNTLSMYVAGGEKARITSAGRLLLGTTTESTFLLDVNGTARVSGDFTQAGVTTANLGYIRNPTVGVATFGSSSLYAMVIGTVSNAGHTATFTKPNSAGTAIRVTGQNIDTTPNYFFVDYLGSTGFNFPSGSLVVSASAQVEIVSTTKGFLPPRMTTTQKNAIGTPAAGLVIYDTDLNKLCVYTGAAWQTITSA